MKFGPNPCVSSQHLEVHVPAQCCGFATARSDSPYRTQRFLEMVCLDPLRMKGFGFRSVNGTVGVQMQPDSRSAGMPSNISIAMTMASSVTACPGFGD